MLLRGDNDDDDNGKNKEHDTDDHKLEITGSLASLPRARSMSRNLIRDQDEANQLHIDEQNEIAKDMFNQMKHLKAHNEAMGYHGYSGYLEKHNTNMRIDNVPDDEEEDDEDDDDDDDDDEKQLSFPSNHGQISVGIGTGNNSNVHKHNGNISQTKHIRQNLENITASINKIHEHLQIKSNNYSDSKLTSKDLKETMSFFQSQLTDIQDQIEDAENDIDSNIDVSIIKYQQQINEHKERVKKFRKEKKDREKQEQIKKQMEQQRIIEEQKKQIAELLLAQQQQQQQPQQPQPPQQDDFVDDHNVKHNYSQSAYFSLDHASNIVNNKKKRSNRRKSVTSQQQLYQHQSSRAFIESEEDIDDEQEDEDTLSDEEEDDEIGIQFIHQNTLGNPGYLIPSTSIPGGHTPPTMMTINPGGINEGHYPYSHPQQIQYLQQQQQQHSPHPHHPPHLQQQQQQQPLLSDNAIKIIGGVVIVLAGFWLVSKYFDNKSKRNTLPSTLRRTSRVRL